MELQKRFSEISMKTAENLKRSLANSFTLGNVSRLTLPEVEPVVDQVARLVPAGNVPGLILSGLARLPGRKLSPKMVKRDINLLFKGVEQTLDKAVYATFFAGPAAVIWGYQSLLKLSGKEPDDAFPEGPWQFYVDYAMREDTARHANESHGFDTFLKQRQIRLSEIDRMTAWVMAAIDCLHQYKSLLNNEWRERVYTHLLVELTRNEPDAPLYTQAYRHWQGQLPYGLGPDAAKQERYSDYRRRKFDQFLKGITANLRADLRDRWLQGIQEAEAQDLPAYQEQMSILAYLEAGPYGETRIPISIEKASIGLIYRGAYYLIPACSSGPGGLSHLPDVETVRAMISALGANGSKQSPRLTTLAEIRRATWSTLRLKLSETLVQDLDKLRLAPILLNFDTQPRHLPLCELRRNERGIGDQALTVFDTGETFVFDQSHIFFDGAWGAALAEIMTRTALFWVDHLQQLAGPANPYPTPLNSLKFRMQANDLALIQQAPRVTPEVAVETDLVDLKAMVKLRRLFKQRNDLLQLTINGLLILYRAIHAVTYQPDPALVNALNALTQDDAARLGAASALEALEKAGQVNPTIVIPIDASHYSPRDRLYPITFEVPLQELNLLDLHHEVMAALDSYQQAAGDRSSAYAEFDRLQRTYLAVLAHLSQVFDRIKEMAMAGESGAMGALRLLAHLPTPLQRVLDKVPGRFEVLNDLIKGREAFSNIGAVAPTSTLARFISAKDDNDKKTLIWGVITDAQGIMRLSLRDFRPHVGLLSNSGHKELAARLSQHYLESYAQGLNSYVDELYRVTRASRETRLQR